MLVLRSFVALFSARSQRKALSHGLAWRNAFQPLFSAFCRHRRCVRDTRAYTYAH